MSPHTKIRAVAFAVMGLAAVTGAQAQQRTAPTATDLRAAYCIEMLKTLVASIQQGVPEMSAPLPQGAPREQVKQRDDALDSVRITVAAGNDRINKMQLYLLPRMQYIDPIGLATAQKSAREDWDRVEETGTRCLPRCPMSAGENCLKECEADVMPDYETVVKSMKACQTLDWLPY